MADAFSRPTPGQILLQGTDRQYEAFSGCDMVAYINNVQVGTLQALTVSITREVVPIYCMGSKDVRCFVKGKRGIAGTLSFSMFDRHALIYDIFNESIGRRYGQATIADVLQDSQQFVTNTRYGIPDVVNATPATYGSDIGNIAEFVNQRPLRYSDEIPPFNITLSMINDNGAASYVTINGIVLVNESFALGMEDITTDIVFTYVARQVTPLQSLQTSQLFREIRSA